MDTHIRKRWTPGSLSGADLTAEIIASKDLNNLYITSCYFSDLERYRAFCAYYAIMRVLDDRIDNLIVRGNISKEDKDFELQNLNAWEQVIMACLQEFPPNTEYLSAITSPETDDLITSLKKAALKFPIPPEYWKRYFMAMKEDLQRTRFSTFQDFVRYADGASVSPTTIYLYLITSEYSTGQGLYNVPRYFNLRKCGRNLGLFAYITHTLRDLPNDLSMGDNGLWNISSEDMANHNVTEQSLLADLSSGTTSPQLQSLAQEFVGRAFTYLRRGQKHLQNLNGTLPPDRAFILELIVGLYIETLKKIITCSYKLMTDEHRLSYEERELIVMEVDCRSGFLPGENSGNEY